MEHLGCQVGEIEMDAEQISASGGVFGFGAGQPGSRELMELSEEHTIDRALEELEQSRVIIEVIHDEPEEPATGCSVELRVDRKSVV